jgi:hypothetical protein
MPWSRHHALAAAAVLAVATGCAEHMQLLQSSEGFETHRLFWPPPPATWTGTGVPTSPDALPTLATAALSLNSTLRQAGYTQLRWYPIGLGHAHGFAVTTRLERIHVAAGEIPATRVTAAYRTVVCDYEYAAEDSDGRFVLDAYLPFRSALQIP